MIIYQEFNRVGSDLLDLVLENQVSKRVDETNYLEIIIDESRNLKVQCRAIKKTSRKGSQLKGIRPQKSLIKLSLRAIIVSVKLFGILFTKLS